MRASRYISLETHPLSIQNLLNYSHKNHTEKLKNILKTKFHKKSVVFVKNGRTALLESLKSIGVGLSNEVIIPAYASRPVLLAVENVCKPKFVDINKNDSNIDVKQITKNISKKTKAIIVVHTYGKSADMEEIVEIAHKKGLIVIEDLAQAPFGKYNKKILGSFGDYAIMSFNHGKDITSSMGGVILSNQQGGENNENNVSYIRSYICFSQLCFSKFYGHFEKKIFLKSFAAIKNNYFLPIQRNIKPTVNFNRNEITDYMASLIIHQIEKIDKIIERRRQNAEFYIKKLKPEIIDTTMTLDDNTFYRFTIKVRHRERLIQQGFREGIEFGNMYNYYLASLINSKLASQMNINIPVHHHLKNEDLSRVVHFLNKSM